MFVQNYLRLNKGLGVQTTAKVLVGDKALQRVIATKTSMLCSNKAKKIDIANEVTMMYFPS